MAKCFLCERETNILVEKFNGYEIYLCPHCELQFCPSIVYEEKYYEKGYTEKSKDLVLKSYRMWFENLIKIHKSFVGEFKFFCSVYKEILKIIPKIVNKNDIIFDFGCGHGIVMKKLGQMGYKVYGCETVKPLVDTLTTLGYNVYKGGIDDYPSDWPIPKVIILSEIIEHLQEPVEFLRSIRQKFHSATLIVTVPHYKRLFVFKGRRELWDYPPNHFTRWTQKSLEYALLKSGYKKIEIIEYPVYWREAIVEMVWEILDFIHHSKKDKSHEDISKLTESNIKIIGYLMLYFLGWILAKYYSSLGAKGFSLIAIAHPE